MTDETVRPSVPIGNAPTMRVLAAELARRGLDPTSLPPLDTERRETIEQAKERRMGQAANRRARWHARLPAMYGEAWPAKLDDAQHRDAIAQWYDTGGATLLLAGDVGTGKTYAAYAVGNRAIYQHGAWGEAWTVPDLLDALRPGGEPHLLDVVRRCHLLVLDDLGAGRATEWSVDTLTAILDARVREGRRQVVTTNATSAQLAEAWGGRLVDRLNYQATVLVFRGQSRRVEWK